MMIHSLICCSCMRGSLLEINERLLENPKLLQDLVRNRELEPETWTY